MSSNKQCVEQAQAIDMSVMEPVEGAPVVYRLLPETQERITTWMGSPAFAMVCLLRATNGEGPPSPEELVSGFIRAFDRKGKPDQERELQDLVVNKAEAIKLVAALMGGM